MKLRLAKRMSYLNRLRVSVGNVLGLNYRHSTASWKTIFKTLFAWQNVLVSLLGGVFIYVLSYGALYAYEANQERYAQCIRDGFTITECRMIMEER